jgi:hypothetical protein
MFMIRRLLQTLSVLTAALLIPGCCLQICITPCGSGCSPQLLSCNSVCGQPGEPGPEPAPLPNTPFTKVTLKNSTNSGKRIVKARVRGMAGIGISTAEFAPPPAVSDPNNWFDLVIVPMNPGDPSSSWTPGTSPAPQSVRNVEMAVDVELSETSSLSFTLEITSVDGCAEPTGGDLKKLRNVEVTFSGLDNQNNGLFTVQRTYYNTENQQGCGTGGLGCTTVSSSCTIAGQ